MTLTTTIETNGTEIEVDLDELDKYGYYYLDEARNLIIRAIVYTHGTKDSRWVETSEIGTDYTISEVEVDIDELKRFVNAELNLTLTDEEAEHIATYYQEQGHEVVSHWMDDFSGDRILSKADYKIISTDVEEPLLGWEFEFEDLITRIAAITELPDREIQWKLFNAARSASPGDFEYSAKIELTGTPL